MNLYIQTGLIERQTNKGPSFFVAALASFKLRNFQIAIVAVPVVFNVTAITPLELGNITITILTTPIIFNISTFATLELRIVEVTVIASPTILNVSTFTSLEFRHIPMVCLEYSEGTPFHSVSIWIANMA